MRSPERLDKFYDVMKELHKDKIPDWRFLQFMCNFMEWIYAEKKVDPFFVEENKCIEYLNEFFKE